MKRMAIYTLFCMGLVASLNAMESSRCDGLDE